MDATPASAYHRSSTWAFDILHAGVGHHGSVGTPDARGARAREKLPTGGVLPSHSTTGNRAELADDPAGSVDPPEGLDHRGAVQRDRAMVLRVVPYSLPREGRLPSNIKPTTCASRSSTGEPELPPMMSLVVQKSRGVDRSSLGLASSQLGARRTDRDRSTARRLRRSGSAAPPCHLPARTHAPRRRTTEGSGGVGIRAGAANWKRARAIRVEFWFTTASTLCS